MGNEEYYDDLALYYKYIYVDWDKSVDRQSEVLDKIIKATIGGGHHLVLDASAGIGTQSIGLAKKGYQVTASDISSREIELARNEAKKKNVEIHFFVADMRSLWEVYQKQFDVVIACDNSIPHLLCDEEILKAFTEFYKCTKPDGCCIISVRDYELLDHGKNEKRMNPRTIHQSENGQIILFDIWNFNDDRYDLSTYVIEDSGESRCNARVIRGGKYYCVTIPKLKELLLQAGFKKVLINKSSFFQPLLIASNG